MKTVASYSLRICFITLFIAAIVWLGQTNHKLSAQPIFHSNGILNPSVKNIFKQLGVDIDNLEKANEFAQKNLLRVGERWDAQNLNPLHVLMENNKAELIKELKSFGMIDEIIPADKKYTYALLMGALKERVDQRLSYLIELQKAGLHFDTLVLLGGERALQEKEKENLPEEVKTEAAMMDYVCKTNPLVKDQNTLLVNAPMIKKSDGTLVRPNTDDTLVHFTKLAPENGNCLVISNNPYVLRQTKVAQRILDQSRFATSGAGKGVNEDTSDIIMLMDEFARTLYEEFKVQSQLQAK